MIDVAIVSYSGVGHAVSRQEDLALCAALGERGRRARIVIWDQPEIAWAGVGACVIRSAYDWHLRKAEFLDWVDATARVAPVWNPPRLLRWGAHKSYLRDLETRGIAVIPSLHLEAGARVALAGLLDERGWDQAVLKPATGIAGRGVTRLSRSQPARAQLHLDQLLATQDAVLQPYLPSIESRGELSVVFVDGRISHAIQRVPRPGDFRAHFLFGCAETAAALAPDETAACSRIIAALGADPLFGRIDLIRGPDGALLLSEIELVAPVLYFHHGRAACAGLAEAIDRRLEAGR